MNICNSWQEKIKLGIAKSRLGPESFLERGKPAGLDGHLEAQAVGQGAGPGREPGNTRASAFRTVR